ncbi:MAG: DNA internalization-related competence protein ComEC/Rec2 [Candidatus Binatia bacterium]
MGGKYSFVVLIGLPICLSSLWWCRSRRFILITGEIFAVFVLGNISLQWVLHPNFPSQHLRHLPLPQQVHVEGWLFREPERFPHRGRLYIETLCFWEGDQCHQANGRILLTIRSFSRLWHYRDIIRVPVSLREPRNFRTPGSFDYEGHLARQGIYLTAFLWEDSAIEKVGKAGNPVRRRIEQLRHTIGVFFSAHLEPDLAAVLRALIIGDETLIDKAQREAFARAGVAHVLSISGLHISLVAATAYGFWWWILGRSRVLLLSLSLPKLASLLTCPFVLLYALLAGGSVATWRAVLMIFAYLFARLFDRQDELYRSLTFTALLISVLWPGALLEISFQLSFMSVLSLVMGMEYFCRWWEKAQGKYLEQQKLLCVIIFRWGLTPIVISTATLLGTALLTATHFNQVSVMGILANIFIVPLLGSGAVILGLLSAGTICVSESFAIFLLFVTKQFVFIGVRLTGWFAAFPYASLPVITPSFIELIILYGLLVSFILRFYYHEPWSTRMSTLLRGVCFVALIIDGGYWVYHRYFHRDLRITFLDVGQGDAAVVEFPGSQVMVIDGGGFASETFDTGEAIIAPFLWSQKIARVDILVMSHPQLDHYGGLAYLAQHFSPRELWFNGEFGQGVRFLQFLDVLTQKGISMRSLCRDSSPIVISQVNVDILHPPCQRNGLDPNNASLVLQISHQDIDILFTGDIENEGEQILLSNKGIRINKIEILKVPHHGSRTSSSSAFVQTTRPRVAIASLGAHNRFHFPAQEVERRYHDQGTRWLRTDQVGTVRIYSDGQKYKVTLFHPSSP